MATISNKKEISKLKAQIRAEKDVKKKKELTMRIKQLMKEGR